MPGLSSCRAYQQTSGDTSRLSHGILCVMVSRDRTDASFRFTGKTESLELKPVSEETRFLASDLLFPGGHQCPLIPSAA